MQPETDREVAFLLADPIPDGGQWNMFCHIVDKYGIVTKQAYGDTFCSDNSGIMNSVLTQLLRQCAVDIRELTEDRVNDQEPRWLHHAHKLREQCVQKVYETLVTCLGKPPSKFEFSYVVNPKESKDKEPNTERKLKAWSAGVQKASNHGSVTNAGSARFVHSNITPKEFLQSYGPMKY